MQAPVSPKKNICKCIRSFKVDWNAQGVVGGAAPRLASDDFFDGLILPIFEAVCERVQRASVAEEGMTITEW